MENKIKHPDHVIGYEGSLDELAQAIGNMSYDQVALFIAKLSDNFQQQGKADALRPSATDPTKTRQQLSANLLTAAEKLLEVKNQIDLAWKISKPHM